MTLLPERLSASLVHDSHGGGRVSQCRVPAISPELKQNLGFWSGYVSQAFRLELPLLTVAAADQPAVDLLVGEPATDSLFCLRADQSALPIAARPSEQRGPGRLGRGALDYLRSCTS